MTRRLVCFLRGHRSPFPSALGLLREDGGFEHWCSRCERWYQA